MLVSFAIPKSKFLIVSVRRQYAEKAAFVFLFFRDVQTFRENSSYVRHSGYAEHPRS